MNIRVLVEYINIVLMVADPLTKALSRGLYADHIDHMGMLRFTYS
jgi:hypothetical protein